MIEKIGKRLPLHPTNKDSAIHKLACMVSDKLVEKGDISYNKSLRVLAQKFRHIDKNSSGFVDDNGFKKLLKMCGVVEPSTMIHNSGGEFDLFFYDSMFGDSGQRLLDWQEFVDIVRDVYMHPLEQLRHVPPPSMVEAQVVRQKEGEQLIQQRSAMAICQIAIDYQKDTQMAENMLNTLITKLYERHSDKLALTKAFKHVDKDNSSTIDIDEFRLVLRLFGFEPAERQLRVMFKMFGADRIKGCEDEEISYAKFIEVMNKHQNRHPLARTN